MMSCLALLGQFCLPSLGIRCAASMRRKDKTDREAELLIDDKSISREYFIKE